MLVSFTRTPDIHRGELAQQSLALRLGLVPLFLVVTLGMTDWAGPVPAILNSTRPVLFLILGYALSSALLALGYRARAFGSSDVIYLGMVDTSLFLGVGTYLTGGAASPALFLFFAVPATYLVLATPRVFVVASLVSAVAMASAVGLAQAQIWPGGLALLAAGRHPLVYLAAAVGALAMLASVGWRHSLAFVARSQACQHLSAALAACRPAAPGDDVDQRLIGLLDEMMAALQVTDEGSIYRYEPGEGLLRRQVELGIRPWFRRFPAFRPGEGNVGYAFQFNSRIICQSSRQLEDMLKGLAPAPDSSGSAGAPTPGPPLGGAPSQTLAVPLAWEGEVFGVLVLSRHTGSPFLDEGELRLAGAFAVRMAGVMGQYYLQQRVSHLDQQVTLQKRLQALLPTLDPRLGVRDFAVKLRELVPFDCLKLVVANNDNVDPTGGYFWCAGDLDLDGGALDSYVQELAHDPLHGDGTLVANEVGPQQVPPKLAELGVSSIAVVLAPYQNGRDGHFKGGLVLAHRLPDAYDTQRVQLLRYLEPYLPLLLALVAGSGMWNRKMRQLESLHQVVDLTRAGGDKQSIVQSVISWTSEQVSLARPGPVFVVLSDPDKGTLTVTVPSSEGNAGFQRHVSGVGSDELQKMFGAWPDSEPQVLVEGEVLAAKVFSLLPQPLTDSQVLGFPFRINGKTLGILAVPIPTGRTVDMDRRASIQQFVDVASLCLQNSQLYEAQARQARELRHEDELRRSFISFITHEFRTPLTSLKASFDLVREADLVQDLADPYQRLLNNMTRSISTLEQLIADLAEVANVSSGGVLLNRYWTSPESIVHPVIEMSAPLSHLKNQSLEVEIQPGLPDIMADSRRLEQVLANLVSNAIKYTPAGGTIRTSVVREENVVKFAVADTGRGIPTEYVTRLFEPFFRVPRQASAEYAPGTGLGLALAKSLVELHGGKIWVETAADRGCTFYFTIPVP